MADLERLLAAWRTNRSELLADTIGRVPDPTWARVTAAVLSVKGDDIRASTARAKKLLAAFEDDPRLTVFLMKCLREARWPGSGSKPLWEQIFKRLVDLRDRRAIGPLRALMKTPPYFLGKAHTAWVTAQILRTEENLYQATLKLPADDAKTLALVAKADGLEPAPKGGWFTAEAPESETKDVLAAVWASPSDDATRLVAADALLERSEVLGEFITLQFRAHASTATPDDLSKLDALLVKHSAAFAGPLAFITTKNHRVFVKGFLEALSTDAAMVPRRRWEEALAAPHWATVKTVDLHTTVVPLWWVGEWLAKAPLRALTTVTILSLTITRSAPDGAWSVRDSLSSGTLRVDTGKYFKAFVRGLSPAERRRLVLIDPRPDLQAAVTEVGSSP